jgi:isoquinoline 1-oxidoreductase alpha subunit
VLLKKNANPTDAEIDAAVTNICRCGVYPRLRDAIQRAARVMRGEARISVAPPPGINSEDAAAAVPALRALKD